MKLATKSDLLENTKHPSLGVFLFVEINIHDIIVNKSSWSPSQALLGYKKGGPHHENIFFYRN